MDRPKNHIKVNLGTHGNNPESFIELNGERLKFVQSVEIRGAVNEMTQVTLTLKNVDVEFEGEVYELTNVLDLPTYITEEDKMFHAGIDTSKLNNKGD